VHWKGKMRAIMTDGHYLTVGR
ncbi:MAG: hypothetical protein JWP98_1048, partial [Edaphobacter sp.]|nr:hypothetical protein [Edaphobacter sp.]